MKGLSNFSQTFFLFLIFFFQAFSSPWPKNVGLIELFLGVFLGLFFYPLFTRISFLHIIFYLLIIFYSIVSFYYQNNISDFARDFLPMLFMALPFLYYVNFFPFYHRFDIQKIRNFIFVVCFIGIVYLVRIYIDWGSLFGLNFLNQPLILTTDYLGQSPSMFMLGAFSLLVSLFYANINLIIRAVSFVVFIFVSVVYYTQSLRAPLILIALPSLIYFIYILKLPTSYKLIGALASSLLLMGLFIGSNIFDIFDKIIYKFTEHGFNGKLFEYIDVFNFLYIGGFFFGKGFGALWESAIEPGVMVSYAHSLINYFAIKFGFLGYFLSFLYILFFLRLFLSLFSTKLPIFSNFFVLAFLPCFAINVFLEPGYKTLEFNLLLFLLIHIYLSSRYENRYR